MDPWGECLFNTLYPRPSFVSVTLLWRLLLPQFIEDSLGIQFTPFWLAALPRRPSGTSQKAWLSMVPEQLSHEHHATWERRLPWPEAPLMNLPLLLAQAEAFYSFWNSREHRLSQPSHVSFDFGKRFSANSYLNLFWTNRNIFEFRNICTESEQWACLG